MKKLLPVFLLLVFATTAAAQVKVTPKKVVYTRGNATIDFKKKFEVTYPKISGTSERTTASKIENALSYWNAFGSTLEEEREYQWLTEMDFKVIYNKNGLLSVRLHRSGVGAYQSDYFKTVTVDTQTGMRIRMPDAFVNRVDLLKKLDVMQEAEKVKTIAELDKEARTALDVIKEDMKWAGKASDKVEDFEVSDKGVTFLFDYGFRNLIKALAPPGRYFIPWSELKPFLSQYGPITELSKGAPVKSSGKIVPILGLRVGGIIGGVQNGEFVNIKQFKSKMKGNLSTVTLNMSSQPSNKVVNAYTRKVGFKVSDQQMDDICPDFVGIDVGRTRVGAVGIGAEANWNPLPRGIKSLSTNNRVYQGVVRNFLKKRGVTSKVMIDGIYRVDLDGDEVEEVVIAATNVGKNLYNAKVGDYSFILVRKLTADGVKDIFVRGDIIDKDADSRINYRYKLDAIADLNGDGIMELVVYGEYYEGADVVVVGIDGLKTKELIATGCGV